MKKAVSAAVVFVLVIFIGGCFLSLGSLVTILHTKQAKVTEPSILKLDLEGIIIDGKDFLEDLKKYREDENIKGIVIQINSPGGVVGASQEIFAEIKRVREELQKPVVVSCNSVVASGAYYAAVAANQIITNPGTMIGSIGVLMEFANLEGLYDWAKVKRYVIKTGIYKDSGADFRAMTEQERMLFQTMIDEVQEQFRQAVIKNRKLTQAVMDKYADGRVFTGETAVKLGFADQLGTLEDAIRVAGELSGLGQEPEVFEPPKKRENILDLLLEVRSKVDVMSEKIFHLKLMGQPLLLMPGTFGF